MTTDPSITRYAYQALDDALDAVRTAKPHNTDEIAGFGPEWACHNFGNGGHDYGTCGLCRSNYHRWLNKGAA
jgi:hypothetical protein